MRKHAVAVIGLYLALYLLPLGWRPLTIPDEARYAEIPREMIASGDWIVPRLNGLRYFEKPVLGYWLNAVSILLIGENAFAVRLVPALSAGLTALLLFFLIRRSGKGSEAAVLGAGAYLTCMLVMALGVISTLDSLLTLFLTGAMAFFFFAYQEERAIQQAGFLALFGAFCGLAFLVKGFLAVAVPLIAIVPFLTWEGRLRDLIRWSWIPLSAFLLVILPWAILIHLREGDFWRYFFWVEHIQRFLSPMPGQHPKPFWYFLPVLAGGALPWTVLLPAALPEMRSALRGKDPLIRFAVCWLLVPFVFFSACSGKLVPYVLPCVAPLVILIVMGLTDYFERGRSRAFHIGAGSLGVICLVLAAAAVLNHVGIAGSRIYGPSEAWKTAVGVAGSLAWAAGLFWSIRSSTWRKKALLFALAPIPFLFSAHGVLPDQVLEERAPEELLRRNRDKVRPDTLLIAGDQTIHAVCWFYKRDDVYLLENRGELAYGLDRDRSHPLRLVRLTDLSEFIRSHARKDGALIFLQVAKYQRIKDRIPEPTFKDSSHGFIFLKYS